LILPLLTVVKHIINNMAVEGVDSKSLLLFCSETMYDLKRHEITIESIHFIPAKDPLSFLACDFLTVSLNRVSGPKESEGGEGHRIGLKTRLTERSTKKPDEPFLNPNRRRLSMEEQPAEPKNTFLSKITDILNYGALNLAMAVGYRTRLFDVMDTFDSPQTVSVIAEKAELNSRYVCEWLGVMVCGGIVELSGDKEGRDRFYLPKEHGDLITRRAENSNLGVYTQEIPLLTVCAMESVYSGFYTGEGIDYANYPKFQDFMAQLANAEHQQVLVDTFLPSVDNEILGDVYAFI